MSYYCENCKRHVERKTKTGTGFWLFVFLFWLPSLVFVALVMFGAVGGMVAVNYSTMPDEASTMIAVFIVGVVWVLFPFIIYFARSNKCPICNTEVKKVS